LGNTRRPFTLDTLTTAPRRSLSAGNASRMSRNGARRLIAIMRSHWSSVVASVMPMPMTPAAFTSTSIPPNRFSVSSTIAPGAAASVTSATTTAIL
jgi:hypothetical protein